MIRINLTGVLYSNKNIDLAYKAKKICREVNINLINAVDFVDLTMKIVDLKPQIVFFDLTTVKLEKEIMKLFVTKGDYHIPNIILIYENSEALKEYEEFNFCKITMNELEHTLLKEEKSLKLNATLCEKERNVCTHLPSEINVHLFGMGFSPKHVGFSFLLEAIKIALKKNGLVGSLNSEVYPLISAKFGTTTGNVERNIRNAIVCAYDTYEREKKHNNDCNLFHYFNYRPTNREFICMYVEEMQKFFSQQLKMINN